MNPYLFKTEYAVRQLIETMNRTATDFDRLSQDFFEFRRKNFLDHTAPVFREDARCEIDTDKPGFRSGISAETASRLVEYIVASSALKCVLDVHAAGLLQIAKQGISSAHGPEWRKHCPNGRRIGRESVRNVLWHGRNQAMHYEDDLLPRSRKPKTLKEKGQKEMMNCFANLESDFGARFSLTSNPKTSLAWEVVKLLNWSVYENFKADFSILLRI